MTTVQLRPLSTGEILDGALVLMRRNFGLLLTVALVCQGVPTTMDVYIDLSGGPGLNPGLSLLDRLLTIASGVLVTGATVHVVSEAYLGRTTALGDAIRFGGSRFGTVFGSNLISGVLTLLATLLLIIPGIVVACGFSVSAPAAAFESGSSSDAVRHSWELTKGFRWKALGLWVVTVGMFLVVYLAVGVVGGWVGALIDATDTLLVVLGACVSLLIYPVIACVFTLFYYDLRIRKEGFDIDMLTIA